MSTLKSVVLTFGENYVWGGFAGEPSPRFSIDYDFDAKFPSTRIRLNELFQSIFVKHLQLKPKLCDVLVVEKFLVSSELRDHILSVLLRDCQVQTIGALQSSYIR